MGEGLAGGGCPVFQVVRQVLKPGGIMATWYGTDHIDECMAALGTHLTFQWQFVSPFFGSVPGIYRFITARYRSVLMYTAGESLYLHRAVDDVIPASRREKGLHDHQQALAPTQAIVEAVSEPGQLVVDPTAGSFTTAEACWRTNRRFCGGDHDLACLGMVRERFKNILLPSESGRT